MFHIARITKVGLHPTYVLTTTKPPLLKTLQWSKQRRKIIDRLFYSQSFTRHHTHTHTHKNCTYSKHKIIITCLPRSSPSQLPHQRNTNDRWAAISSIFRLIICTTRYAHNQKILNHEGTTSTVLLACKTPIR